jgi:hypothetical protein
MADGKFSRRALGLVLTLLAFSALVMPSANAAFSGGASANCDSDNHCVTGGATSSNVGANVQIVEGNTGAAVAICTGTGNGATLMQITCSIGGQNATMSFPGTAGAVPLQTTQARLERLPVCWHVIGYFPTLTGLPHEVPTGACAQLAL